MKIEIEISDDELREHILVAAGNALHKQYSTERNLYKRTIADCVREVIYKDKKEIIDRIIVDGQIGLLRLITKEGRRKSETNMEFGRIAMLSPHRLTAAHRRERRTPDARSYAVYIPGFLALGWDGYPSIRTQPQNYYKWGK